MKPGKLTAPYSGCAVKVGISTVAPLFLVIHSFLSGCGQDHPLVGALN